MMHSPAEKTDKPSIGMSYHEYLAQPIDVLSEQSS